MVYKRVLKCFRDWPCGRFGVVSFAAVFLWSLWSCSMASAQELYVDYNQAGEMVLMAKPQIIEGLVYSQDDNNAHDIGISVSLYPNPVTDILNIDFEYLADERGYCLVLSDIQGNVIKRVENIYGHAAISMESCAPGTYVLTIAGGLKKTVCKIIKQ